MENQSDNGIFDKGIFDIMKENDYPSKDNQLNELKKEIQELRKENFQLRIMLESLSEMIWNCFEQLGQKLDKDMKNLKEEIMYSKD